MNVEESNGMILLVLLMSIVPVGCTNEFPTCLSWNERLGGVNYYDYDPLYYIEMNLDGFTKLK